MRRKANFGNEFADYGQIKIFPAVAKKNIVLQRISFRAPAHFGLPKIK